MTLPMCVACGKTVGMTASRCDKCKEILCQYCKPSHQCIDRPAREVLHLTTAHLWAERSVCKRSKVGCVITTPDMRQILAFGYNGPAKGLSDHSCTGEEGKCGCLHAEDNACIQVDARVMGKRAFVTVAPCFMCAQRLINAGVEQVYYSEAYRDTLGLEVLTACGVESRQISLAQ